MLLLASLSTAGDGGSGGGETLLGETGGEDSSDLDTDAGRGDVPVGRLSNTENATAGDSEDKVFDEGVDGGDEDEDKLVDDLSPKR